MALNERYIPLNSLNEFYVNKDNGLPLSNGKLFFFRDTNRSTPKTVYQLSSSGGDYHYVALPNPIDLNSVGTAQNAAGDNIIVYAFPYLSDPITSRLKLDQYYIVCTDETGDLDNPQWTREAVPYLSASNDPVNDSGNEIGNQLSNPQFTRYFLNDSTESLTVSGAQKSFPIAPNWELVASGTGNITVERIAVSGGEAIPTYPAYYLKIITNIGVTNPFLRQRLKKNSGLWSGNFIAGFVVANLETGSNALSMKYRDSSGVTSNVTIFNASLIAEWESYGGSVQIGDSGNSQSGNDAYVDIIVELPTGSVIDITSLQVIVTDTLIGDIPAYSKNTANREQALMGDYYIPRLEYKNVASLLVGWDFPMNPRQFKISGSVAGGTAEYIWDQTILKTFAGLTVDFGENVKTNGLSLTHKQANSPYALIQYLDQEEASKFVGTRLSVNVNGYTVAGVNSAASTEFKVHLFANKDADKFYILPDSPINLANDGSVTLTGSAMVDGWYEINRSNLPIAKGTLEPLLSPELIDSNNDFGFNNWVIDEATKVNNGVRGIIVVVSFMPSESTTEYKTQIDSISVTQGDIPTRPANLCKTLTLDQCRRYYESTYTSADDLGQPDAQNYRGTSMPTTVSGPVGSGYAGGLEVLYHVIKRIQPKLTFYSVRLSNINKIDVDLFSFPTNPGQEVDFSSYWEEDSEGVGVLATTYHSITATPLISAVISHVGLQCFIGYHCIIDARIGIDLTP